MRDLGVSGVRRCAFPLWGIRSGETSRTPSMAPPFASAPYIRASARAVKWPLADGSRSEERRVGKERRSRWSPYHYKKNKDQTHRDRVPVLSPLSLPQRLP